MSANHYCTFSNLISLLLYMDVQTPPLKKKMVIYASKSHSIWGKALPKIRLHFQLVTAFNIHIQTSGLRLCRHLPCYWHLPPVSLAHTMQIVVLHEFIFTGNDADLWSVFVHFACIFFFFFTLSYLKITLPSHPFVYSINLGWRGAEGRLFAKTPKISLSHWQVWKSVCPNTINRKRQQPKHGYHQFSISKWNNDEEADNTIIFQIHNCTVLSHVTLV